MGQDLDPASARLLLSRSNTAMQSGLGFSFLFLFFSFLFFSLPSANHTRLFPLSNSSIALAYWGLLEFKKLSSTLSYILSSSFGGIPGCKMRNA
jgi:hypothetical protein